ncbi:conserved hypothetical protein [metagenome]|uniref:Uncharacterized protein n=1 Tax=metagenome TaxID=256318 RepID=A0A2P2CCQ9_9ZZZZ
MSDPRQVPTPSAGLDAAPYDPLRLCIFATVALLGWLLGPVAVAVFAAVGFLGYWKARRAGLLRSRCALGDTRIVLVYLAALCLAGVGGLVLWVL